MDNTQNINQNDCLTAAQALRHVTGRPEAAGQHFRQGVARVFKVWHIIEHIAIPRLRSQDHGQHRARPGKAADSF
jgi:hypothetical protein